MSWSRNTRDPDTGRGHLGQVALVHLYKDAARLPDPEYRALLHRHTGCDSSTHRGLTQYDFHVVMAALEQTLEYRCEEAIVPATSPGARAWDVGLPSGRTRRFELGFWRTRLHSLQQPHAATAGQVGRLTRLWRDDLGPRLPPEKRTDAYLAGIASRACGHAVADPWRLTRADASLLIDALADVLKHAFRTANQDPR